jgi:hypothetical protein
MKLIMNRTRINEPRYPTVPLFQTGRLKAAGSWSFSASNLCTFSELNRLELAAEAVDSIAASDMATNPAWPKIGLAASASAVSL